MVQPCHHSCSYDAWFARNQALRRRSQPTKRSAPLFAPSIAFHALDDRRINCKCSRFVYEQWFIHPLKNTFGVSQTSATLKSGLAVNKHRIPSYPRSTPQNHICTGQPLWHNFTQRVLFHLHLDDSVPLTSFVYLVCKLNCAPLTIESGGSAGVGMSNCH
jgi:hypothetical protein